MSSSRDTRRQMYAQLVGKSVANGRFKLVRLLGFGGMGGVYEAVQTNMSRSVALKLIPTHDPTTVARFEREAKTISRLRHPNTVTVFDYGQSGGFLFLTMELLAGRTLAEVIEEDGPLVPERAVHIASQICRSLNEAHHAGIVHRDIKPDNVILITIDDDPDVVKVLDFGIAKAVMGEDDVQLTGDGRIIGTPRYMSPEQILAESLDHRSDIYSLGCILFEMLCGAPPFQQSSTTALMISHTQEAPPAFAQRLSREQMDEVPAYLEHVVLKALSKDPNDRYQETEEFRVELERALTGAPLSSDGYMPRVSPMVTGDPDATAASLPSHLTGQTGQGVRKVEAQEDEEDGSGVPRFLLIGILVLMLMIVALVTFKVLSGSDDEDTNTLASEPTLDSTATKSGDDDGLAAPAIAAAEEDEVDEAVDAPELMSVELRSEPRGARVWLDGEETRHRTPTMLALKVGEAYDLELKRDGYEVYSGQFVPKLSSPRLEFDLVRKKVVTKPARVDRKPAVKPEPKKPEETEEDADENVEETPTVPRVDRLIDEQPSVKILD